LNDALADIATVREQGNPSLRLIGVVLSAIKGRSTRLQRELIGYVQQTFDKGTDPYIKSYSTQITETTYICESQKLGKTMFQLYPTHKVTDQFRELAREIEARLNALEGIETLMPTEPQANVEEVVNG
jgi:cellulose biosynthesis protein BcsQ